MTSQAQSATPTSDVERYLGYLDKEMTIMGILSAFCVLTVGGIANAFKDVEPYGKETLAMMAWKNAHIYIAAGCLCVMVAALFFYRQRSHLAWCYGQTCLTLAKMNHDTSAEWLEYADGWSSWRGYKAAFAAVGAGFAEFVMVTVAARWPILSENYVLLGLPIVIAAGYAVPMHYVMEKYEFEERPWVSFFADRGVNLVKKEPRHPVAKKRR